VKIYKYSVWSNGMLNTSLENSKILIVDDQQSNIDVLTGLLDAKGYKFYKSTTESLMVIKLFEEYIPDIILLDLNMPHLSGFQVMIQLNAIIPPESFIPILVLTADVTSEAKQKALAGGATDFLTKPFDLVEVDLRIQNLLRIRILHQQIKDQNILLEEKVKERTSELEKTNVELISAKEKAEEMNKLKSIFLANMSHELRTPLISVLGFAELLQLEITDTKQLELVAHVLEGGKRLNITLNSILEWSKLESEKYTLKLSKLNLAIMLQKNVDLFKPMVKSKNLFLKLQFEVSTLQANIDQDLIEKAFFQLIHNAIKFTSSGGVSIILKQINKDDIDWAVIRIVDTGIGIPKEYLEKIFAEFRQGSEGLNRSYEGSGLGLSIARKLIELMNGKLEIESEVGKGTIFSIYLPVLLDETAIKQKIEEIGKTIEVKPENEPIKFAPSILCIEDNVLNRLLVHRLLEPEFLYSEAEDGFNGIAIASKKQFDLVLLDINLGVGINGIETMYGIRKLPGYSKVPIIAVTAHAMLGDRERLLKEGFDDYLQKPFSKEELISIVKKSFDNKMHWNDLNCDSSKSVPIIANSC
jgi:signal transduction histidine kinase